MEELRKYLERRKDECIEYLKQNNTPIIKAQYNAIIDVYQEIINYIDNIKTK